MPIADIYRAEGLLPYSKLPDITDPEWDPYPLVVERIGAARQYLMALGLAHRTDVGNRHYRVLAEESANFIVATAGRERIIINEGGVWPIADNTDLAYAEGGESMWLQTFGYETGTTVVSPELDNDGADLMLAEGFTHEEIACYYFDRQVPQYHRMTLRPSFEAYMQPKMVRRAEMLGWDFDFSLPNLIAIHEKTHQRRFDPSQIRFFYRQSVGYMLPPTSRIQQAAIICNMGRDINLLRIQQEYFDRGVSVLTGFGMAHILALQPRLEQMGTSGETRLITSRGLGPLAISQYVLS